MTKKARLKLIEKIISEKEISTQEELTLVLTQQGCSVSQSTVSRDIYDLDLIKVEGVNKKFKYAKPQVSKTETPSQIINLFKQVTVSMECANNLIVIKTLAGNASAAGMAIDQMHLQHVVGTVAGDDTLLVVAKTNSDAEIIVKSLRVLQC